MQKRRDTNTHLYVTDTQCYLNMRRCFFLYRSNKSNIILESPIVFFWNEVPYRGLGAEKLSAGG